MSREQGPSEEVHTPEGGESMEQQIARLKETVNTKGDERRSIYDKTQELRKQLRAEEDRYKWKPKLQKSELEEQLNAKLIEEWKKYEAVEAELRSAWDTLEGFMGTKEFTKWLEGREKAKPE